jgi:hypothetical protein
MFIDMRVAKEVRTRALTVKVVLVYTTFRKPPYFGNGTCGSIARWHQIV